MQGHGSPGDSQQSPRAASSSANASVSATYRRFHVDRTPVFKSRCYKIRNATNHQVYCLNVSEWTPRKPDLTLHLGPSTSAPVVAVSHFVHFSRAIHIGLGDPATPDAVRWEEMKRPLLVKFKYSWDTGSASTGGPGIVNRRTLAWKRTISVGVEGSASAAGRGHSFKLVDESTGEILAAFMGARSLWKGGVLEVRADFGKRFDDMVLMTCMSVYEKERRSE